MSVYDGLYPGSNKHVTRSIRGRELVHYASMNFRWKVLLCGKAAAFLDVTEAVMYVRSICLHCGRLDVFVEGLEDIIYIYIYIYI